MSLLLRARRLLRQPVCWPSFCAVQGAQDAILLDTAPYAAYGAFAVNLWMRRLPGANLNGSYYSYLYSHTGATISAVGQSPNQASRGLGRESPRLCAGGRVQDTACSWMPPAAYHSPQSSAAAARFRPAAACAHDPRPQYPHADKPTHPSAQVAIYLPNAGHPAFGVVRAIVADAADSGPDLFYLDSDGTVGSDLMKETRPRVPPHAGQQLCLPLGRSSLRRLCPYQLRWHPQGRQGGLGFGG